MEKGFNDLSNQSLYIAALYFTVTTIVTVGYGDISAFNSEERVFCIFLMLTGVISFSFATGTLASLISSYDSKNG
jgi:voltage-gated potassium channel